MVIPKLPKGKVSKNHFPFCVEPTSETEVVAPLETIKQAFEEALKDMPNHEPIHIPIYIDGVEICQNNRNV